MFEKTYREIMERNRPSGDLLLTTAAAMEAAARSSPKPARALHPLTVALVCILISLLSVTAVSAAFPGFREFLFGPASGLADSLTPVTASAEQDGIQVEVLGAMSDETGLTAYYTLTDLRQQDRLDREMDVIHRVRLNGSFPLVENELPRGTQYFTRVLDYDPDTQTALCRLDMVTDYPTQDAQVKLSFLGVSLWGDRCAYAPLELSADKLSQKTIPIFSVFSGPYSVGPEYDLYRDENGDPSVLEPGKGFSLSGLEYARITAAGFIGQKLHIQTWEPAAAQESGENSSYSLVCAPAGTGRVVAEKIASFESGPRTATVDDLLSYKLLDIHPFSLDDKGGVSWRNRQDEGQYMEYVFDIGPEELENFEFFAHGSTGTRIPIDLAVEFPLESSLPQGMAAYGPLDAGAAQIESLEITPMGVYLTGTRGGIGGIEALELVCGEQTVSYRLTCASSSYYSTFPKIREDDNDFTSAKYLTDGPAVDPAQVTAVRINGIEVPLT